MFAISLNELATVTLMVVQRPKGFEMKKASMFLYGVVLTASFTASADVLINVPEDVSILVVNMKKPNVENSLFSGKKLTLPNGENQILFKYIPTFESGNEIRNVSSEAIVAKFNSADTTLDFKFPDYRSIQIARENIREMEWTFVDSSTHHSIPVKYDFLIKDGVQYGRDYITEAREYNLAKGAAAIKLLAQTTEPVVAVIGNKEHSTFKVHANAKTVEQTTDAASNNIEQLKAWYSQSSEEERKAFRKWIVDQE